MTWWDSYWRKDAENKKKQAEENAKDLYQICEHDNALWITYNGNLVCPCSFLKDDAVVAVNTMRKMYVERNSKEV